MTLAGLLAVPLGLALVGAPGRSRDAGELARLAGHRVVVRGDRYHIVDVAGDGPPRVGVVERRGDALWLVERDGALRLTGPLAVPRIAGPGYTVWVVGALDRRGALRVRRLGVLRPPRR